MIHPSEPINEKERMQDLHSYSILDTLSEDDYDSLTTIASEICNTKISLVSLVDDNRQWFKSHHGLDVTETPRNYSFCAHALNTPNDIFIVEDARNDERFYDNPLVTGMPHVIFYAGVPLVSDAGYPLGSLCVIDTQPRSLSSTQVASLKALSKQVINLMELRKIKNTLEKTLINLEEKNHELERFAIIAAHDLKSPLNNIVSLADVLMEDYNSQLKPEAQKLLAYIKQSASKLNELIMGLLEYSMMEQALKSGKIEVSFTDLQSGINSLFVNDCCNLRWKSDVELLVVNKTVIEQILINLISNAIKYNDKSIADIEIGVSENDDEYKFYVKDNGPGIASKYQDSIFGMFQTHAATDKFGEKGNGIGLATVKKIIQNQGGTITVESKIGDGALFIFTLMK